MTKIAGLTVFLFLLPLTVLPQAKTPMDEVFKKVELLSPWVTKNGKVVGTDPERRRKSCFDLILLEQGRCNRQPLGYGARIGNNWDVFQTEGGGRDSRTRMIELGKYNWTDKFNIPEVAPGEYVVTIHDDKGPPGDPIYSALETMAYVAFPPVWPFVFRSNQTQFNLRVLPKNELQQ